MLADSLALPQADISPGETLPKVTEGKKVSAFKKRFINFEQCIF